MPITQPYECITFEPDAHQKGLRASEYPCKWTILKRRKSSKKWKKWRNKWRKLGTNKRHTCPRDWIWKEPPRPSGALFIVAGEKLPWSTKDASTTKRRQYTIPCHRHPRCESHMQLIATLMFLLTFYIFSSQLDFNLIASAIFYTLFAISIDHFTTFNLLLGQQPTAGTTSLLVRRKWEHFRLSQLMQQLGTSSQDEENIPTDNAPTW